MRLIANIFPLLKEPNARQEEDVDELLSEFYGWSDEPLMIELDLLDHVLDWPLTDLLEQKTEPATRKREADERLWQQKREEEDKKNAQAEVVWMRFLKTMRMEKLEKLSKNHPKWTRAKKLLELSHAEDSHLLARKLCCSNSIRDWLTARPLKPEPKPDAEFLERYRQQWEESLF